MTLLNAIRAHLEREELRQRNRDDQVAMLAERVTTLEAEMRRLAGVLDTQQPGQGDGPGPGITWPPEPPPPPPDDAPQALSFTEDTTGIWLNPDQGWMDRRHRTDARFANARTPDTQYDTPYSVVWNEMFGTPWAGSAGQNPFRLDNYRTQNLPQSLLDELPLWFDAARSAGIKLKVRFAYNYANIANNDTSLAWMLTHMDQLAPILNANRDAISCIDSGFIGAWGEWSILQNSVIVGGAGNWFGDPARAARRDFLLHQLDVLHDDIMLALRVPSATHGIKSVWEGSSWQMPLSERFTGTDQSRVGWYNDSLYTGQSNGGTFDYFNDNGEADRAAFAWVGQYAPTSGETSEVGTQHNGADAAGTSVLAEMMRKGGPDLLFRRYNVAHYNRWISEGQHDNITRRLGYRLALTGGWAPTVVAPGASATLQLTIKNAGSGKVFNVRPIDLVFVGAGGPFTARLTSDARRDLPLGGETVTSEWEFTTPAGLEVGQEYALHLRLPDPDPLSNGLAADNRYAIRLANTGVWDGDSGRHDLGASVSVSA